MLNKASKNKSKHDMKMCFYLRCEIKLEKRNSARGEPRLSDIIIIHSPHVRNVFKEGELSKESVWAKFAYTAADGKVYDADYYNLDVIISVGYRMKSKRGTQFRIRATGILWDNLFQGILILRNVRQSGNR